MSQQFITATNAIYDLHDIKDHTEVKDFLNFMARKDLSPSIGYRPSSETSDFIEAYCGEGSTLSKAQLIDVALKFLKAWPKEEIYRIIGRSASKQEIQEFVNLVIKSGLKK